VKSWIDFFNYQNIIFGRVINLLFMIKINVKFHLRVIIARWILVKNLKILFFKIRMIFLIINLLMLTIMITRIKKKI
jgi:hypothetical protein